MSAINSPKKITIYAGLFESVRMLTGAVSTLFLLDKGFSLTDIAYIQFFYTLTKILADVPTGYVSDTYGKKNAVITGCLSIGLYYITFCFATNINSIILSQIFYAIGMCFMFGSLESWIVSSARLANPFDLNKINYYGHLRREISGLGNMIAGPVGAVIASTLGFKYSYLISFFCILVLAILFLFTYEHKESSNHHYFNHFNDIIEFYKKTKIQTSVYIALAILISLVYQPVYYFWQPLLSKISTNAIEKSLLNVEPTMLMGLVFFVCNTVIYIFNKFFKRKLTKVKNVKILQWAIIIELMCGLFFYLIIKIKFSITIAVVLFACIHGFLSVINSITDDQYFKHITCKFFSTLLSYIGVVQSISTLGFLLFIKFYFSQLEIEFVFIFCPFLLIIISLLYLYSLFIEIKLKEKNYENVIHTSS